MNPYAEKKELSSIYGMYSVWLNVLPQIRRDDDIDQMRKHIDRVEKRLKAALERYEENV